MAARQEMETTYFAVLYVQRFAPVLAKNGGGANCKRAVGCELVREPVHSHHQASKAAEEVLTGDAIRVQIWPQRTHVAALCAGYIDTDISAHVTFPRLAQAKL